ncbi:MAG: hypothetical protein AAF483_07685 [Planctomycetota bacterium]
MLLLPLDQTHGQQMSFSDAAKPYTDSRYAFEGYVDKSGQIQGGGLGCSAYVSVVLHRMRNGPAWLKSYDLRVHQQYGDEIAKHFGLRPAAKVSAADLCKKQTVLRLVESGRLKKNGLYLFDTRNGKAGHVGFLRIKSDGSVIQSHYSGMKQYNGLASGEFSNWLTNSQYRKQQIQLFQIQSRP